MLQEEGDFDQLDHDQVRDEVGRIHHRQILDEDKREVRLFQEAFLEDGELHSDNTRARKFHWKNIDDDNYDMSLRKSDSEGEEDLAEEEEKRRLERLERQKWIQGMYFFLQFFITEPSSKIFYVSYLLKKIFL